MFKALRFTPFILSTLALECHAGEPTLVLRSGDVIEIADPNTPDFTASFLSLAQVGPSGDVAFNAYGRSFPEDFISSSLTSGIIPRERVGDREATAFSFRLMPIDGASPLWNDTYVFPITLYGSSYSMLTRVGRTGGGVFSAIINGADQFFEIGLLRADPGAQARPIIAPGSCDTPAAEVTVGYDGISAIRGFMLTDDGRTLAFANRGCSPTFEDTVSALIEEHGGHIREFLAVGDPAPGAPGQTIGTIRTAHFNREGEVVVYGGIDDPDDESQGPIATIWAGTPDALSMVAREGDPVPDEPGLVYDFDNSAGNADTNSSVLKDIAIHRGGEVSFVTSRSRGREAVFRTEGGMPRIVVRGDDPTPTDSVFFGAFSRYNTVLEPAGPDATAIFSWWREELDAENVSSFGRGVWISRGQRLDTLLREGDALDDDLVVDEILSLSAAPDGNVAIVARAANALDTETDRTLVLYGWSPVDEQLRVIARQSLDVVLDLWLDFDIEDFFDPDAGLAENGHIVYRLRTADPAGEFGIVDELYHDRLPSVNDLACAADFNGDGDVDLGDFGLFASAFDTRQGEDDYEPDADIDADGDVDLGDFGAFGAQFGRTDCGT